jgi:hypothetical protein
MKDIFRFCMHFDSRDILEQYTIQYKYNGELYTSTCLTRRCTLLPVSSTFEAHPFVAFGQKSFRSSSLKKVFFCTDKIKSIAYFVTSDKEQSEDERQSAQEDRHNF